MTLTKPSEVETYLDSNHTDFQKKKVIFYEVSKNSSIHTNINNFGNKIYFNHESIKKFFVAIGKIKINIIK